MLEILIIRSTVVMELGERDVTICRVVNFSIPVIGSERRLNASRTLAYLIKDLNETMNFKTGSFF